MKEKKEIIKRQKTTEYFKLVLEDEKQMKE